MILLTSTGIKPKNMAKTTFWDIIGLTITKDNESQAGSFLALISNQFGHKYNDYLRQIIAYEYPNNSWEKDNFSINPEYKILVEEVLKELK